VETAPIEVEIEGFKFKIKRITTEEYLEIGRLMEEYEDLWEAILFLVERSVVEPKVGRADLLKMEHLILVKLAEKVWEHNAPSLEGNRLGFVV
jgi:hypothetical protein